MESSSAESIPAQSEKELSPVMPERSFPDCFSEEEANSILSITSADELEGAIRRFLKLTDCEWDLKDSFESDYFTTSFWWAIHEQTFSSTQLSAFYSIILSVLQLCIKPGAADVLTVTKFLKECLVKEENRIIFSEEEGLSISSFVFSTIIQHLSLYQFIYQDEQAECVIQQGLFVDAALPADIPWPPPLEEALPDDLYRRLILKEVPCPETSDAAEEKQESEEASNAPQTVKDMTAEVAKTLESLSFEEIEKAMRSVVEPMLAEFKNDFESRIIGKENDYISRINKIHRTSTTNMK